MSKNIPNINLNNFNISTFFPNEDGTINNNNGNFTVNSLFKKIPEQNNVNNFDSKVLLKTLKQRRKKLLFTYMNMYNLCCVKIKEANTYAITDIIFEVNNINHECVGYSPLQCLLFIKKKLDEQLIETHIMNPTHIFITWYNLESKIEKQ